MTVAVDLKGHIVDSKIDEIVVNKHVLVYLDFWRAGSLSLQLY